MPIPVITQPASPRIIAAGAAFSLTLSASNSPTSWAVSSGALPSGLSLNTSSGAITGTPTATETTGYSASFTATNVDGTSAAVTLVFTVMASPPGASGSPWDLILDYEVGVGNTVSIPGKAAPAGGEALFSLPQGTNRYLLVGLKSYGVLQDINPAEEAITIALALKAYEPEGLLEVTTGVPEKIAAMPDDLQRYRVPIRITPGNWASALSDNEDDAGTEILALAELQVTRGTAVALDDFTLTDTSIAIEGDVTTPITGDHDFSGLSSGDYASSTPMRLTLTLSVASRPLQTVELVREFDLIYTGGAYVLSNLTGSTTGQGAAEGTKWRATLNLTALTGDANSVDADYSITTSEDTTVPNPHVSFGPAGLSQSVIGHDEPMNIESSPHYLLELWDGSDEMSGTQFGIDWQPDSVWNTPAEFAAALEAAWESRTGSSDVVSVSYTLIPLVFTVHLSGSSPVTHIRWDTTPTTFIPVDPPEPEGAATTCSVSARLEQLSAPANVPLNLTSDQFLVRVARDIVPD